MAKLMARKGQGEGESGGSASSLLMKRSKSGDIPRPDSLSLVRSVSGELRSEQSVLDRHRFDAGPDPASIFYADPDRDPIQIGIRSDPDYSSRYTKVGIFFTFTYSNARYLSHQ